MPPEYFDEENPQPQSAEISVDQAAGNSDVEDAAAEIAGEAPVVQEHAVAAALERDKENQPANSPTADATKLDDFGTPFDPAKHTGSKLKNGAWRERKKLVTPPKKDAAKTVAAMGAENSAKAAGSVAADMLIGSMQMMFGGEWAARTKAQAGFDEREFMREAFGNYAVAKQWTDIPPGVALSCALMGYFCARFQMPETRSRFQRFKTWLALRIAARKLRAEFKKRGVAAIVEIKDGVLLVDGKPRGEK